MIIFLKKILAVILIICIFQSCDIQKCQGKEVSVGKTYSTAYCVMDGNNGRALFGKKMDSPYSNASTTKILTCIIALESCQLDEKVTVSKEAAGQSPVKLGISQGEEYVLKDMIYCMMLESYNDCAYAVAEHVGKSAEKFAEMMNKKAKELGCKDSNFVTPNGLDSKTSNHHTTAEDMCRIMRYCAWVSPCAKLFIEITGSPNYSFKHDGKVISVTNHNNMLSEKGYISGKTGYTSKAGYCYVAAWEKNGKKLVVTLLGCGWPNNKNFKWKDTRKLIEYADTKYKLKKIKELEKEYSLRMSGVHFEKYTLADLYREVNIKLEERETDQLKEEYLISSDETIEQKMETDKEITEIQSDGEIGQITYFIGEEPVCRRKLVVCQAVKKWKFSEIVLVLLSEFL